MIFLRSKIDVVLEQIKYGSLKKRDFIYSYFSEGEDGISSVGGISGGGSSGGGDGSFPSSIIQTISDLQESSHNHPNKDVLDLITEDMVEAALRELITSIDIDTELTDENMLSSLRVLKEIADNNENFKEELKALFLSKVNPDTAAEIIKFTKGLDVGAYTQGLLGGGGTFRNVNGTTILEADQLLIRQRAEFFSVLIHEAKSVGGELVVSAANMLCIGVEETSSFYRCFFDSNDGKVTNLFENTDFARCQIWTGTGQKFYWRKVLAVGTDYIELSKTNSAINSDIPAVGDNIYQLGSTDVDRQGAMILSTVGADSPSFKQYSGISGYSLEGKATTEFTRLGNRIQGKTVFRSDGSNVDDWGDDIAGDIQDSQAAANAAALAAQQAIDDAAANVTDYNAKFATIQAQVDGEISNYSYPYSPTLSNYPASEWTTNTIKDRHIGDTFFNNITYVDDTTTPDAGKAWRFLKNGSVYSWSPNCGFRFC